MREDSLKFRVIIKQTSARNDKQITLDNWMNPCSGKIGSSGSLARIVFLILNVYK